MDLESGHGLAGSFASESFRILNQDVTKSRVSIASRSGDRSGSKLMWLSAEFSSLQPVELRASVSSCWPEAILIFS